MREREREKERERTNLLVESDSSPQRKMMDGGNCKFYFKVLQERDTGERERRFIEEEGLQNRLY